MPNADTAHIRNQSRRVKGHILTRYLKLADRVDEKGEGDLSDAEQGRYWELTKDFAKNVIPRSQEITGEDGEKLIIPIYGGQSVSGHNSDQEGIPAQEENTSS